MERTLIILKPDALQRDLIGDIINRLERKGLTIVGIKMMRLDKALLSDHYAHIADKPFYQDVESFMQSAPVVIMALEGYEAVETVRLIVGATNPRQAAAGTIRGDLSIGNGRNLIHASDSVENGKQEVARFFKPEELFDYQKDVIGQIYAPSEREG
jgi:nucleoside-diphosphate kinase